jgi:hypothetical protein
LTRHIHRGLSYLSSRSDEDLLLGISNIVNYISNK